MIKKPTILISPYAKKMRNGKENPKNFPWWLEVVQGLKDNGFYTIQLGVKSETSIKANKFYQNLIFKDLKKHMQECHTWISIDTFLGHLGEFMQKPGIVLFGKSDPKHFGYEQNINLLKDQKYLRDNQFELWESETFDPDVFVSPETVIKSVMDNFPIKKTNSSYQGPETTHN